MHKPLKTHKDIDKIISSMIKYKHKSMIAIHRLFDHHPARIKKIVKNKIVDFNFKEPLESRRQDLKPFAYVRSGSIYGMRRDFLLEGFRYKSKISVPYILKLKNVINIDEEQYLKLARILLNEKKK